MKEKDIIIDVRESEMTPEKVEVIYRLASALAEEDQRPVANVVKSLRLSRTIMRDMSDEEFSLLYHLVHRYNRNYSGRKLTCSRGTLKKMQENPEIQHSVEHMRMMARESNKSKAAREKKLAWMLDAKRVLKAGERQKMTKSANYPVEVLIFQIEDETIAEKDLCEVLIMTFKFYGCEVIDWQHKNNRDPELNGQPDLEVHYPGNPYPYYYEVKARNGFVSKAQAVWKDKKYGFPAQILRPKDYQPLLECLKKRFQTEEVPSFC